MTSNDETWYSVRPNLAFNSEPVTWIARLSEDIPHHKQILAKLDLDLEFAKHFHNFMSRCSQIHTRLYGRVIAEIPTAAELKEGKQSIIGLLCFPEEAEGMQEALTDGIREVHSTARVLASFFPVNRRWHWEEIFVTMAFGGLGNIEQQRSGGPHGLADSEREYRQQKAKEAIKLRSDDPKITWKEVAKEINWLYGRKEAGIKKLKRAIEEYQNGQ